MRLLWILSLVLLSTGPIPAQQSPVAPLPSDFISFVGLKYGDTADQIFKVLGTADRVDKFSDYSVASYSTGLSIFTDNKTKLIYKIILAAYMDDTTAVKRVAPLDPKVSALFGQSMSSVIGMLGTPAFPLPEPVGESRDWPFVGPQEQRGRLHLEFRKPSVVKPHEKPEPMNDKIVVRWDYPNVSED